MLGDFNFKDIAWPDQINKSGSLLNQSEGQMLIDVMNDHGLEQLVHFSTREKNILDLILISLPGQFQEIHSPDKLSNHGVISGTLKIQSYTPKKKARRNMFLYRKKNLESMWKDASDFAKDKYMYCNQTKVDPQASFDCTCWKCHPQY